MSELQIVLRPIANGALVGNSYSGDSDYYLCVDEEVKNNDTDYIYRNSDGNATNSFKLSQMPKAKSISNVTITHWARQAGSPAYIKHGAIVNGVGYISSYVVPPSSYTGYTRSDNTNPKTGNPWTSDEINTDGYLQSCILLEGQVRCTQVYITVTYEPIKAGGGILNWWFFKEAWQKHDRIWKPKLTEGYSYAR